MYIFLFSLLESLKHSTRNRYKLIRCLNHIKYLFLVYVQNFLVKRVSIQELEYCHSNNEYKIIASLTSFPIRINECALSLKTLFMQTIPPDRIILWLADSQFPNHNLPAAFDELITNGLEVRYVDDLRSHKKYFYMLQEQQPDELVITFDDDIIYHPKTIERAFQKHLEFPDAIVCNEVKYITFSNDGKKLKSYNDWGHPGDGYKAPNIRYSVMSGSGTLYPYGIFPKEVFDWETIKRLAYSADDLWITFMAKHYNIPVVGTDIAARVYTTISNSQSFRLGQENCIGTRNDDTVRNILTEYPSIIEKMVKV